MKHLSALLLAFALLTPAIAHASDVKVVVTIKPIHSLVQSILGDEGEATLLLDGVSSPHTYSMKPSHAAALAEADLIIWVGPSLERFLEGPVANLSSPEKHLALGNGFGGVQRLSTRTGGVWETDHDDHHGHHDAHGSEDEHDDHTDDVDTSGAAFDGNLDPHIWLNAQNALAISHAVQEALAHTYPDRMEIFHANAEKLRAELEALDQEIKTIVAPVKERPYFVFHDAYQYFEKAYALNPLGAMTATPDLNPGASRLQDLRNTGDKETHICVFAEPQFNPRSMEVIAEGRNATIAYLDPLGSDMQAGANLYGDMMRALATNLAACLGKDAA